MSSNTAYQKNYYDQHRDELREKARLREQRKRALAKAFVSATTQANSGPASPNVIAEVSKFQGAVQRAQHLAGESPACKGVATHALANIA